MNTVLKSLAIFIGGLVMLKTDEPISRLSILYLISLILLLLYKKKWSYFVLLAVTTFPIVFQINYYNHSGIHSIIQVLYRWLSSFDSNLHDFILQFPVCFSIILMALLLLPATRNVYGFGKK
jgi:hypothetical protein